jgi:hypothetical protein
MAMIVWKFNLQLPIQSMPITTDVVRSNLDQGESAHLGGFSALCRSECKYCSVYCVYPAMSKRLKRTEISVLLSIFD